MIYRFMYVAYSSRPEEVKLLPEIPHYAALANKGEKVFLYIESNEPTVDPEICACGDFRPFPDGTVWVSATEIFHYSVPMNREQWKRKTQKTPVFQINRLKREKIASYVYYHFQYQEEYPGDGDRYGVIFLFDNEIIFYLEDPAEKETEHRKGLLSTKNSPIDQWQKVMEAHFEDTWRPITYLENNSYIDY